MSGTLIIHHIACTQHIPYFIICLAHQLSTILEVQRTYNNSWHVRHNTYPSHYRYTEHTIFHHMSGTPTIHNITGTQNIYYLITYLEHQLSTTLQVHRTYNLSWHICHTNYTLPYGYAAHTIFHGMSGTTNIHHILGTGTYLLSLKL